jgi:tRNA threonylcarbamoyladenosine biosynthesis protein TsaB
MITLTIDTSEARGSVAVLEDGAVVAAKAHEDATDYSMWLLPAVGEVLVRAGTKMEYVDLYGVATGPGSFTGLRVGLTTVKAWSEVYGKPIAGVSRLEAMARSRESHSAYVASCYDAQRGQLFGAIYHALAGVVVRVGEEFVVSPEEFVQLVDGQAGSEPVTWITLDPALLENLESLQRRVSVGDRVLLCSTELASTVGVLAMERAAKRQFSDPLALDANYVRRSDAEIFWKGSAAVVP